MLDDFAEWLKSIGFGAANRLVTAALMLAAGICLISIFLKAVQRGLEASKLEKAAHTLVHHI